MLADKRVIFAILFLSGAFVKDPMLIVLPAWALYQWLALSRSFVKTTILSGILAISFVTLLYVARITSGADTEFYWSPDADMLQFNLYRWRSWLSTGLTLGPFSIIAIWYLVTNYAYS